MSEQRNLLSCGIIKDLLPLYRDGVACEETAEEVKAHLETCEGCAAEYQELCAALPVEESPEAQPIKKFAVFQKKLKSRRFRIAFTAAALTCVVLLSGFFVLTRVPMVPISPEEVKLRLIFRYESDGKEKLFLAHTIPWFSFQKWRDFVLEQEGGCLFSVASGKKPGEYHLKYEANRPILSERGAFIEDFSILELPESIDPQSLWLGEKQIWTAEKQQSKKIPGYVYEIDQIRSKGECAIYQIWSEFHRIDILYPDGRLRIWDLDGEELYSGLPDAEGLYLDAPEAQYISHEYHGEGRMGMSYSVLSLEGGLADKGSHIFDNGSEPSK